MLSRRSLIYLGEISFSLYLCHLVLMTAFGNWGLTAPMIMPVYVVTVIAVSAVFYRYVERPANRAARQIIDGAFKWGVGERSSDTSTFST